MSGIPSEVTAALDALNQAKGQSDAADQQHAETTAALQAAQAADQQSADEAAHARQGVNQARQTVNDALDAWLSGAAPQRGPALTGGRPGLSGPGGGRQQQQAQRRA